MMTLDDVAREMQRHVKLGHHSEDAVQDAMVALLRHPTLGAPNPLGYARRVAYYRDLPSNDRYRYRTTKVNGKRVTRRRLVYGVSDYAYVQRVEDGVASRGKESFEGGGWVEVSRPFHAAPVQLDRVEALQEWERLLARKERPHDKGQRYLRDR